MRKLLLHSLLTLIVATVFQSCSDSKEFSVEGTVRGLGFRTVTLQYVSGGIVRSSTATAVDSKFFFTGTSRDYTLAELSTADRRLGFFVVRNGEHIKCRFDVDNPDDMSVSGNKTSEQVSAFMSDNAQAFADRNQQAIDSAIVAYIKAHTDNMSSTVLLMTLYDNRQNPAKADSLMSLISEKARPASLSADYHLAVSAAADAQSTAKVRHFTLPTDGDSLESFVTNRYAASLLYFRGHDDGTSPDSIAPALRRLRAKYHQRTLHVVEIGMVPDTLTWRRMLTPRDTITWTRVFSPGGRGYTPFQALDIPRLPFFIVADETGNQLYRGSSITEAAKAAKNKIEQ